MKKVGDFHGHICTGIVLGTRMTLAAMRHLGLDPYQHNRDILAYAEVDRCMTDAVMIITGCSLGRRSLKHVDYGKFAMTLINQTTGKAVRAIVLHDFSSHDDMEENIRIIKSLSDEELVTLRDVTVNVPAADLPGFPVRSAVCAVCGEQVMDARDVEKDGKTLCRGCAEGTYYEEVAP
jgi:formylmethanofuran dehydrogenase subunit E